MNNNFQKPMSILMTTDTVAGEWSYSLELIQGLDRYDVNVALAAVGNPPSPEQMKAATKIPNVDVFECGVKDGWTENADSDVALAEEWLEGLQHIIRPDVIHLISNRFGSLNWKSPLLITILDPIKVNPDSITAASLRKIFRRADIVAAPDKSMIESLNTICHDIKDTRVIPHNSYDHMTDAYFSAYSDLTKNRIDAKKYSFS